MTAPAGPRIRDAAGSFVQLGATDHSRLTEFCRRCTDFFELVEGQPGGAETAEEILGPLPERFSAGTRHVFGLERAGELVGLAELLAGHPQPNEWYVGLLLLLPEIRRGGVGAAAWLGLRAWIHGRRAVVVRLLVQQQNAPARRFWERQGFAVEEETVVKVGNLESSVWRMALRLGDEPSARSL